ncbi:hypothetical protein AAY473_002774 [Plecturocebus cupreus]
MTSTPALYLLVQDGWSAMAQSQRTATSTSGFKRFSCLSLPKSGFHHVGQAGLKHLTSGDPPASASQSAGITGMSHCTQAQLLPNVLHGCPLSRVKPLYIHGFDYLYNPIMPKLLFPAQTSCLSSRSVNPAANLTLPLSFPKGTSNSACLKMLPAHSWCCNTKPSYRLLPGVSSHLTSASQSNQSFSMGCRSVVSLCAWFGTAQVSHLCQQSRAGPGGVLTLTLERDIHKFRVVQGESIYQAAGITPFGHDLRKERRRGARENLLEPHCPGPPHPTQ